LALFLALVGPLASQPGSGSLKPGESINRKLPLEAHHAAVVTFEKQDGSLRIQVRAAGMVVRDVSSNVLSVAPVRLLLLAANACDFDLELSNAEKTGKPMRFDLVFAPAVAATAADQAEWDAEAVVYSPPARRDEPKPSPD